MPHDVVVHLGHLGRLEAPFRDAALMGHDEQPEALSKRLERGNRVREEHHLGRAAQVAPVLDASPIAVREDSPKCSCYCHVMPSRHLLPS